MSNMENLDAQLCEKDRQQRVYEKAMASLQQQRLTRERNGMALMLAWDAFGEGTAEDKLLGKTSKFAGMFCIGFAFLTPCLLFMAYALN